MVWQYAWIKARINLKLRLECVCYGRPPKGSYFSGKIFKWGPFSVAGFFLGDSRSKAMAQCTVQVVLFVCKLSKSYIPLSFCCVTLHMFYPTDSTLHRYLPSFIHSGSFAFSHNLVVIKNQKPFEYFANSKLHISIFISLYLLSFGVFISSSFRFF